MRYLPAMILISALMAGSAAAFPAAADPMTYADLKALPQPKGGERIAYGPARSQFAELWLPAGKGPHPVVVMLHGGCWQADVAGLGYMNAAAADLARRGMAVWSIEYRRVDEAGGGYPGTFQDVATAIDRLREEAPKHDLDLERVVAVGHSAGGHLALWAAGRANLPRSSPLHTDNPLPIGGVVGLGALPDLKGTQEAIQLVCGANIVDRLTGPASPVHADVFGDTSPVALLPLGAPAVMITGVYDPVSPPWISMEYRREARAKGDQVEVLPLADAGHYELVTPGKPAWDAIAARIQAALHRETAVP